MSPDATSLPPTRQRPATTVARRVSAARHAGRAAPSGGRAAREMSPTARCSREHFEHGVVL